MIFVWIAVIIAAVVLEALTASLVSIWFIPAGVVACFLALFDASYTVQIIVFLAISLVCAVFSRTVFKRFFSKDVENTKTDIDTIIGEKCVVTEKIDNVVGLGQVKVKGTYWSARSVEGKGYDVGEILTVIAIEGVKLICKK